MASRILHVVEAFVGGMIVAFVATVVHGVGFPWVVGIALLVVGSYCVALRLLDDNRITTVAGMIGIIVTVFVLAQRSPGGSVLIAATDAGNVWVLGSSLIAGLVAVWPKFPERRQS